MLTPKQLKSYTFQAAGRNAYKASDVDEYVDEVYASYEQMFRENAELVKRIGLLAEKIAEYKSDEDNIRNALLTAERMKDSILAEAQEKAKETIAATEEKIKTAKDAVDGKMAELVEAANKDAERIVSEANERAEETLKLAQSNATKLLAKAQEIYDEQVNTVKDEADKEREYLFKVKEESAKVRAQLMDTYKTQIELLEFTPDFTAEVAAMHAKSAPVEAPKAEETPTPVAEEVNEEIVEEVIEEAEAAVADEIMAEDDAEVTAEEVAEDIEDDYPEDDFDVEDSASVDDYLGDDEFEDIDSGNDIFADEDVVYEPDDMELEVKMPQDDEPKLF